MLSRVLRLRIKAAWEVVMKLLAMISILCAIVIGNGAIMLAAPTGKDIAVVDIPEKTMLMKTALLGKYIFVHDDEKMASGEPCFYIYEYSENQAGKPEALPDKLVISFHCQPITRAKARQLITTVQMGRNGEVELREIQFAGTTEGHRVP